MTTVLRNWAGNIAFSAGSAAYPQTIEQVRETVRDAEQVRVLGSGHSFNRIADSAGALVSLHRLERRIEINHQARSVTLDGGATYADIAPVLHAEGLALANVASLPNITVAGAIATGTHGSGDANRSLSAAVSSLKLVTADGDILGLRRGDPDFDGAVVNLGALGVITELTLDLVPGFAVRQNVYLGLPVDAVLANFDALMSRAYSVSLFTRWQGRSIDQVWVKARDGEGEPPDAILDARAADAPCHPIPGLDGSVCTGQLGIPGPWHERLFHFAIGNTASAGAELQSEFFVARCDAAAAIAALHAMQNHFARALFVSEIRSVAADTLWLSPAYEQDTIGFHFTWKPDWEPAIAAVKAVEAALAPFAPRPHWAKVFTLPPAAIHPRFPKLPAFRDLANRLDPARKFRNRFVDETLFG